MKFKLFLEDIKKMSKHPFFGFIIAGLVLICIPALKPIIGVTLFNAIAQSLILFIAALGFTILLGYGGLASLGTSSFIGIGTFAISGAVGLAGLPLIVAIAIAFALSLVIGIIFGFVSLRIEGMYLAIVTLGISELISEAFKNLTRITGGNTGITVSSISIFGVAISTDVCFIIMIIVMVILMIITFNIMRSPVGRAMLAMKNSTSAATTIGISVLKYRLMAFVLSSLYATVAGLLYMMNFRFSTTATWGLSMSLNILAAVIVGGASSIWGVFLGAILIFGLDLGVFKNIPFFSQTSWGNLSYVISGLLIILVVMYYPGGIIRLLKTLKYKISLKYKEIRKKRRIRKYGEE